MNTITAETNRNYRLTEADLPPQSLKARYNANIAAIKLTKQLASEYRRPTDEEKAVLAQYSGFGCLPNVFAEGNEEWAREQAELKELLSDEEYDSAQRSTLTAFYTPPTVIRFVWAALQRLGFNGGAIIEPGVGIGHFFGMMPEGFEVPTHMLGIEIDALSAAIAKKLYEDLSIRCRPFEEVSLADGAFDLAVGNIPFGDFRVFDREYARLNAPIHDYFLAKATDKVRPGGLIALITSRFTMDKKDSTIRQYLAERADLLAAIRLPDTAFRHSAGTDAVTDILILKRKDPEGAQVADGWLKTGELALDGGVATINEYFLARPEMMIGVPAITSSQYGPTFTLEASGSLEDVLSSVLATLPCGIYQPAPEGMAAGVKALRKVTAPDHVKQGAFCLHEGKLHRRDGETLEPVKMASAALRRVTGMVGIRDAVRTLLSLQQNDGSASEISHGIADLNQKYDAFVDQFGHLSDRTNGQAFRCDPDYPLLLSLEVLSNEGEVSKADIFRKRVLFPQEAVLQVETASEALAIVLNQCGAVDLGRICALCSKSEDDVLTELDSKLFFDPAAGEWVLAEEYLSGNVKEKLAIAQEALVIYDKLQRNVDALRAVQPEPLKWSEIHVSLGAAWVPATDVMEFVDDLLQVPGAVKITCLPMIGRWAVALNPKQRYAVESSVLATRTWGTFRMHAIELIEHGLNQKLPTVYDLNRDDRKVFNERETAAAREKLRLINEEFKRWIWSDQNRRDRLVADYNERFNTSRVREYDGSHLTLPGSSPAIELRPHQKNSVWRDIVSGENHLLWHFVGSGKTMLIAACVMERRRLGLASKAIVVVPNHLVDQWGAQWLRLYPSANILLARKEDFDPKSRKLFTARIATGDWDAVIMPYSIFERLPVSAETAVFFMRREAESFEDAIRLIADDADQKINVKRLRKRVENLKAKIKARLRAEDKDDCVNFEDLGAGLLCVDEADLFKNLFFPSAMSRIAGVPQAESNRAFDMFVKTQWLNERFGPGRVTFATATAISNSVAEVFTMQRFLQPSVLGGHALTHFDLWAKQFGEVVTALEVTPDGSGFRAQSRFASFINVPDLMGMFRGVADIITQNDVTGIAIPEVKGGKPETVVAPKSRQLAEFQERLVKRVEAIKERKVTPSEDNMLAITTAGRKAALDMRLVGISHDAPDSKVNMAVENIYAIWKETEDRRLTQMAFCNLSTPQPGFNLYDDIKRKLVAKGIPEDEIAFMQDAKTDFQKHTLFAKVRRGIVRVLLGSDEVMGAGTDVQDKLYALHEIDAPWRPRDVEQREGRIVRQGNVNPEVRILRYVTEGSFDSYIWQLLETKARFIAQFAASESSVRTCEDVDQLVLTYAEVKAIATGNPLVVERYKVEMELRNLRALLRQHLDEKYAIETEMALLPHAIRNLEIEIEAREADLALAGSLRQFRAVIHGVRYDDVEGAGEEVYRFAHHHRGVNGHVDAGSFGEFGLFVRPAIAGIQAAEFILKGRWEHAGRIGQSKAGVAQRIEQVINQMPDELQRCRTMLDVKRRRLSDFAGELRKGFAHHGRIAELEARLKGILQTLDVGKDQVDSVNVEGAAVAEAA